MEALAALGVACNILQLVTLAGNLISQSHEAYKSADGLSNQHSSLETTTTGLLTLHRQLVSDSHRFSNTGNSVAEIQLQQLVRESTEISNTLIETLQRLKSNGSKKRWQSVRHAFVASWKQKDIADMQTKLGQIRQQLDTTLLVCLREQMDNSEKNARDQYRHVRQHSDATTLLMKGIQAQQKALLETIQKNEGSSNEFQVKQFSMQLEATADISLASQFSKLMLAHLEYAEIQDRYERICQAHRTTFEWIFKEPEEHRGRWDDFPRWLRNSTDQDHGASRSLYYITGKPGSGKSTLFKHIFDDDRTLRHLEVWAGDCSLLTAGFFFWNSGVDIQMSGIGLLRTLLYQLLRQGPHLIRQVFHKRWESYQAVRTGFHDWTWRDLQHAFEAMAQLDGICIALFIDGLDEFDGDHEELAEFLLRLAGPSVKICVASRPWLVFEDTFENQPKLLLEHLTRKDIKVFVSDAVAANKHFTKLQRVNHAEATEIIEAVVEKASGVFLWVHLVVKSLLQGLANADRISDLKRRLDSLPADLEQLFDKLLRSLEPFYFSHASQLIQLLRAAPVPPTPLEMSYADEEDPLRALKAEVRPWTHEEIVEQTESIRRRLNSRCKGLIGVSQYGSSTLQRVEFLHRTVKDYMQKPTVWASILDATPEDFDPTQRWASSILMELKTSDPDMLLPADVFRLVQWGIQHAEQAENATRAWQTEYLDEMGRTIEILAARNPDLQPWAAPEYFSVGTCFLALVFEHGMVFYIRAKLEDESYAISDRDLEILLDSVTNSTSPMSEDLISLIQSKIGGPDEIGLSTATTLSASITEEMDDCQLSQPKQRPKVGKTERRPWSTRIATKMEGFWSL